MKITTKILLVLAWLVILISIYIEFTWEKTYQAPFPAIKASTDSAMVARGRYLVYGPMHCANCHVPVDKVHEIFEGRELPMVGNWEFELPVGTFRGGNITTDSATGIGNISDEAIARALRYNVGYDGRYLAPFMQFQNVSDEDLKAVISFLRSQAPVAQKTEPTTFSMLGKTILAFSVLKPLGPQKTPPAAMQRDTSIAYGEYLVNEVASCANCHTNRSMKTGKFLGPKLAGGRLFEPNIFSNGYSFVPPNLTPDPETGVMTNWTEAQFIQRFHIGPVNKGSPMFWGSYAKMDDIDLAAMYRYLQSLTPI